jgi:hypothetical protein
MHHVATHERPRYIDEVAMPAGLFPGSSKRTFDALYFEAHTQDPEGHNFQATRRRLLEITGLRSHNTLDSHLKHFARIGVLRVSPSDPGDHRGNFYQVLADRFPQAVERFGRLRLRLTPP